MEDHYGEPRHILLPGGQFVKDFTIFPGHYFDSVIPFDDVDYVYQQLMYEINLLEREPQWVPAKWVAASASATCS